MILVFAFLTLCVAMCVYRIFRGPRAADRMVGIDILGIIMIIFCVLLSLSTGSEWYMSIAIAWSIIGFVSTLTLAKFLEGRNLDD
ncbi:MAG: monovalent cation/H+ antiporter complex subunit F [Candidatus Omnitrophica bacterium]|nr:monovalent cation/H+ antiporter complex subunit F [Candidatus Omnitrophota bacterium]MCM8777394.1 monovalent cation/H+ antiporter complex subunit F [Candidatus Omnitrophota bacterium]